MSTEFDDGGERDEFGLEPPEDGEPAPQADTCLYVYVHNNTACGLSLKAHAEGMTVSHDFVAKRDKRDRDPRDVMADMGWIAKKPVEPAPQTKGACTCKNVPLTASSGGISAPQPECPEHWPDPDAAVRALIPDLMMVSDEDGICFRCRAQFGAGVDCRPCRIFAAGRALGTREEREACLRFAEQIKRADYSKDWQESADAVIEGIARRGKEGA